MPSDGVRTALSVWLPVHLFALLISLTACVESSSIQNRLQELLRPYLQLTHFSINAIDERPLYLAHGNPSESPHRLEITTDELASRDASVRWRNPHFRANNDRQLAITDSVSGTAGLAVSDRYARWLATAATLAESEQPSLVAELLLPVIRADDSIRGVRIVRHLTDLIPTNEPAAAVPYVARVVRDRDRLSLVRLQADRLVATASQDRSGDDRSGNDRSGNDRSGEGEN